MSDTTVVAPFQRLLDEHGEALLGYVRASVGPAAAEDCFQDAVLAALRSYDRSSPGGDDPRPWLFTIAHGVVVDHHRRRERRSRPQPVEPRSVVDEPVPADDAVWAALAGLPPKQRSAVALRVVEDLSYRRVAEIMGSTEPAARRNVHVALKRLREELES